MHYLSVFMRKFKDLTILGVNNKGADQPVW